MSATADRGEQEFIARVKAGRHFSRFVAHLRERGLPRLDARIEKLLAYLSKPHQNRLLVEAGRLDVEDLRRKARKNTDTKRQFEILVGKAAALLPDPDAFQRASRTHEVNIEVTDASANWSDIGQNPTIPDITRARGWAVTQINHELRKIDGSDASYPHYPALIAEIMRSIGYADTKATHVVETLRSARRAP